MLFTMDGENWPLVVDEPVESENLLVDIQDFRKVTDNVKGIYKHTL